MRRNFFQWLKKRWSAQPELRRSGLFVELVPFKDPQPRQGRHLCNDAAPTELGPARFHDYKDSVPTGLGRCAILASSNIRGAGVRVEQEDQRAPATWVSILVALLVTTGCSTVSKTSFRPSPVPFPPEALVTERGVLTVLGRQFTLNGYLALSLTGGKRLVVTENFGSVLADVLITPDGTAHVMRSSRALKPEWIRRYLAADVQCLTGGTTVEECPGEMISPTHYLVQRRWYRLDLQTVNVKPGPQPATMFDASRAEKP